MYFGSALVKGVNDLLLSLNGTYLRQFARAHSLGLRLVRENRCVILCTSVLLNKIDLKLKVKYVGLGCNISSVCLTNIYITTLNILKNKIAIEDFIYKT